MDEPDLAAYEADAQPACWCCDDCRAQEYARDVRELVAEVRRLRAQVEGLKQTQTVGTARVIGPAGTP